MVGLWAYKEKKRSVEKYYEKGEKKVEGSAKVIGSIRRTRIGRCGSRSG